MLFVNPGLPAPRLSHDPDSGEWSLWWPCRECGGATILLFPDIDSDHVDDVLAAATEQMEGRACPGCVTRSNRAAPPAEPTAWYDTEVLQWVVRVPRDTDQGAIEPLQIRWYDAPHALVQTAAAQVIGREDLAA